MTPEKPPLSPDERARKECLWLATYFERTAQQFPATPTWQFGLRACQEWLRVLEMSADGNDLPVADIEALVRYAVPYKEYGGTSWMALCFELGKWALSKGVDEARQLEYR